MKKISEIKRDRLCKYVQSIASQGITQRDIASRLNVKPQYLNNLLSGHKSVTDQFLDKFAQEYKINLFGFLSDESIVSSSDAPVLTQGEEHECLKCYYGLSATASNIENLDDNELHKDYRLYRIPGFEGCIGFPVSGDSMMPTMQAGEIVAIDKQEVQQIINGEIYLTVTRDGQRMVKRLVVEDDEDGGVIRCISDNPDKKIFKDFLIKGENIHKLYRVRGSIKLNLFM